MWSSIQSPISNYLATSSSSSSTTTTPTATPKKVPQSVVFVSSGLGGCLGWAVVHPANTVAVRMSLAAMNGTKFNFGAMIREKGFMTLYDGLSAGILRQVFYATSRFGLFETFRDIAHEIRGKTDFAARYVTCS
jgi:solute carrier family 25 (mitochondrial oxoglutarate transporter), member 11